jgi:hypothetical protein
VLESLILDLSQGAQINLVPILALPSAIEVNSRVMVQAAAASLK